jgi:hypothetical protein
LCASNTDCCIGSLCVGYTNISVCEQTCTYDSQCDSGCCAELDSGTNKTCAPGDFCDSCGTQDAPCSYQSDCCGGFICVNFGDSARCTMECTRDGHCPEDCCVGLEDSDQSVCAPGEYCGSTCKGAGETCSRNGDCCSGYVCVNWGDHVSCAYECSYGSECNSGCCADLESGSGACGNSIYCSESDGGGGDECPFSNCRDLAGGYVCVDGACECSPECTVYGSSVCCGGSFCAGDCIGSPCC